MKIGPLFQFATLKFLLISCTAKFSENENAVAIRTDLSIILYELHHVV